MNSRRRQACSALLLTAALVGGGGAIAQERQPAASDALSLRAAVLEALSMNPDVRSARDGVDQAGLSVRVAESAFSVQALPSLSGSFGRQALANQTYGLGISRKFTTGTEVRGSLLSNSFQNQLGNYFNADTTLQITQPLLRGFGSRVVSRGVVDARSRYAGAERQLGLVEQQVAVAVATSYYDVIVQTRLVEVARTALDRATGLSEASTALLSVGRVSQLDELRAQQLASQSKARLIDAEDSVANARDRLSVLIGRPIGEPFSVDDRIQSDGADQPDVAASIATAMGRRPEILAAQDAIVEQDRAVAAARNALLPQVDVGVGVTRRNTAPNLRSSFSGGEFEPVTFANVSVPLERTPDAAALQTAVTERSRRERDLATTRDRIAIEVRQAARRLTRASSSLALARASADLAVKEMDVASLRFQRGLSNNLDLVSAQSTYREAQAQQIAAEAELALARIGLRAATGVLDPRQDF